MRFAKVARLTGLLAGVAALAGCAVQQDITKLEQERPKQVCIVKNDKVFDSVLEPLQEGFAKHGLNTRVVSGTYEKKHSTWHPTFNRQDVAGCDALLFYVANWNWDLAYYMYFANIWMTNGNASKRLAQATYDASHNLGLGKFIVAKTKILELVDQMLAGVEPVRSAVVPTTTPVPSPSPALPAAPVITSDAKGRLEVIEDLHKRGLLSDSEYAAKRREILEKL